VRRPSPPDGMAIPMRTGKVRSAIVIMSRGLPGISYSLFVFVASEYALGVPGRVNAKICARRRCPSIAATGALASDLYLIAWHAIARIVRATRRRRGVVKR